MAYGSGGNSNMNMSRAGGSKKSRRSRRKPKYNKWRGGKEYDVKTSIVSEGQSKEIVQEITEPSIKDLYQDIEIQFGEDQPWDVNTKGGFILDDDANEDQMSAGGVLISHQAFEVDWNMYTVASGRICLHRETATKVLGDDMEISELESTVPTTSNELPTIDFLEIRNFSGQITDGNNANTDMLTNEPPVIHKLKGKEGQYAIMANHCLIVVADAYNFIPFGEDEPNRENIKYTWRFSSGTENYDVNVIEKIVSNTRELKINNIQRDSIGTYTLEVSNINGRVFSKAFELYVRRPGKIKEVKMTVGEQEILTGQMTWVEIGDNEHDERFTPFDNKFDFDYLEGEFIEIYYRESNNKWYTDKENRSYEWSGTTP